MYDLQLIGYFTSAQHDSLRAMSYGLSRAWTRFLKGGISLRQVREDPADATVTVVHALHDERLLSTNGVRELRRKSKVLVGYSELPTSSELAVERLSTFDLFYYFASPLEDAPANLIHVPPAYEPSKYPNHPPLRPKHLLLDHTPLSFVGGANWGHPMYDWTASVWRAVECLLEEGWKISQLERNDRGLHPEWVDLVPVARQETYLRKMAEYCTFVVTHAGSFNHSAKDAAILGLKVIVPCRQEFYYVPTGTCQRLGMKIVHTEEELMAAIRDPHPVASQRDKCLTFDQLVQVMNDDILRKLQERSA